MVPYIVLLLGAQLVPPSSAQLLGSLIGDDFVFLRFWQKGGGFQKVGKEAEASASP